MNPFAETLRPVWENPRHVSINWGLLERMAQELTNERIEIPNWRLPCLPEEDDENFVQFLGVTTAINFCFTDPRTKERYRFVDKQGKEWQGAMAMSMAMKEARERGIPVLDPDWLRGVSKEALGSILEKDAPIPLLAERVSILQSVGFALKIWYEGSFSVLCERADYRLFDQWRGIVERLNHDFPHAFCDESFYERSAEQLKFYKKAQLFAMMYQGRALDSKGKLPLIQDIDDIGVAADYVLPKILRHYGVLVYTPELARKVDNLEIVEKDSSEEQEIRAQTWQAMIALRNRLSELRGENVSMLALDNLLWRRGRVLNAPHHLTPTTAY